MGLFDAFKSKAEPAFNTQRSVMTVVIAALLADGDASDEEIGRLRSMCARSPIFASNSKEEDDAVINFAVNAYKQLGFEAVVKAAAPLTQELRETAFAFATEVVLADGIVGKDEEQFIGRLAETLKIPEDLGQAVIGVTIIRGRGP